jgi:hypothetical protein
MDTTGPPHHLGSSLAEAVLRNRAWAVRQFTAAADLTQAIMLGARVLADCERVLGPDHPDTLHSRSNLAGGYQSAGRLDDAIRLDEQTLADGSGCSARTTPTP